MGKGAPPKGAAASLENWLAIRELFMACEYIRGSAGTVFPGNKECSSSSEIVDFSTFFPRSGSYDTYLT